MGVGVAVDVGVGVGVETKRMKKCISSYLKPPDTEKLPLTVWPTSKFAVMKWVSLKGTSIIRNTFPLGHEMLYHTIREKTSNSLLNTRSYEPGWVAV